MSGYFYHLLSFWPKYSLNSLHSVNNRNKPDLCSLGDSPESTESNKKNCMLISCSNQKLWQKMYFGHKSCINRNKPKINPFWYSTYLAHPNYIVSSFYFNPFMTHYKFRQNRHFCHFVKMTLND